jgi:Protein kinase domain/Ankyrin repeats (many copies)
MSYEFHQPGDIVGNTDGSPEQTRYRILSVLGEGNSGITYKAQDLNHPERTVALKVMSLRQLTDWKMLDLFEREAKVLAQLKHPGIPRYLGSFALETEHDRRYYIVQTLAEGQSLEALVQQGWRADESTVRKIAQQILSILIYLQKLSPPIIHRDLKPQNIIRHENGTLFLVDFGAVRDTYYSTLMRGSTVVGTYGYMAPEQFRGQSTPATDLYGLGATLLFLLTHRSPADLPQQGLHLDFRDRLQVSEHLIAWLEKLLEPDVGDRFASAQAALDALKMPIAKAKSFYRLSRLEATVATVITAGIALFLVNTFKWRVLSAMGFTPPGVYADVKVLRDYLNQGGNPNAFGTYNWSYSSSPRQLLFCVDDVEAAKLLLQHGANPNAQEKGESILYKAALKDGNPALVKLLVEYGADVNQRAYSGRRFDNSDRPITAPLLFIVLDRRASDVARVLINAGADINAGDDSGETPLDVAVRQYLPDIVELLASKGAVAKRDPEYAKEFLTKLKSRSQSKQ